MPYLLKDLQQLYAYNMDIINQIEEEFGEDYYDIEDEYTSEWSIETVEEL